MFRIIQYGPAWLNAGTIGRIDLAWTSNSSAMASGKRNRSKIGKRERLPYNGF